MSLGERIKRYEAVTRNYATPRMPLIIRVDGKAFHTLTKNAQKPFDQKIMDTMVESALEVAKEMQGFKVGYIQSDEATFLLTDYDKIESQGWFSYNLSKIISTSAALMSVHFNKIYGTDKPVTFDSRAFSVPREDVSNVFIWRMKDWGRNSLQMYARSFFSHKELHNKKAKDMHEMLYSIGKNWTNDLTDRQKNGTFIYKTPEYFMITSDLKPEYLLINDIIGKLI